MKIKFKQVALAALGFVSLWATSANAISTTSGGQLFLMAYDTVTDKSFVASLNSISSTATGFTNSTAGSIDFTQTAAATNWSSFITGATLSNVQYSVLGVDTTSSKLFTTAFPDTATGSAGSNAELVDTFNGVVNGGLGSWLRTYNSGVAAAGTSAYAANSTVDGSAGSFGTNWYTSLSSIYTPSAINTSSSLYQLTKIGSMLDDITVTPFTNTMTLTGAGVFTVAAVPESDPMSMVLVGAGLIGLVVRRRAKQLA